MTINITILISLLAILLNHSVTSYQLEHPMNKTLTISEYASGYGFRVLTMYGTNSDDGDLLGTDFCFTVSEDDGVIISTRRCGRTRGCFWSEPEEYHTADGFFVAVQDVIRAFGRGNLWHSRIGKLERW